MNNDNVFKILVDLVQNVNFAVTMSGIDKKDFVMQLMEKRFEKEEWELYESFIALLVDFLVEIGKKRIPFNLIKKRFHCCL